MTTNNLLHTFTAACTVRSSEDKDDVLALAVSRISSDYHIESARATRHGDIVFVTVKFKSADQPHVIRLARLTAEGLSHRWPTDSVKIDGRSPKYHDGQKGTSALLEAAKQSGHLIISVVD